MHWPCNKLVELFIHTLVGMGGSYKPVAASGLLCPPVLTAVRHSVLPPLSGPSSGYGSVAIPSYSPPVVQPPGSGSTQCHNGHSWLQYLTSNNLSCASQFSLNNISVPQSYFLNSTSAQSQYASSINGGQTQYQTRSGGFQ